MRLFLPLLLIFLLSGCATLTSSYPVQAHSWKVALAQGQGQQALTLIGKKVDNDDAVLYDLEAGRIAQLTGDYAQSKRWFHQAATIFDRTDSAAHIRVSGLGQDALALISNDRAIDYRAAPYERIFSYTFQALNYLALGNESGAAVEFRRVDHAQRQQELRHQEAIAEAEADAKGSQIDTSRYQGYFQGLNGAAALVRSGIENAYSYYLTAAFWEGRGQYNDALVDYKKALQLLPSADFIKADIQRVSAKLNGKQAGTGLLVVALEQGFVASKKPVSIPIPTNQGIVSVSFPTYQQRDLMVPRPMRVAVGNQYVSTAPLARVGAIAAHALKEKIPGMLVRQIMRTTAKYALQKAANRHDSILSIFIQVYNLVSEKADLRSWLTLPANVQVARMQLTPGSHQVRLSLPSGSARLSVPITQNSVTLLRVMEVGGRLVTQVMPVPQGEN